VTNTTGISIWGLQKQTQSATSYTAPKFTAGTGYYLSDGNHFGVATPGVDVLFGTPGTAIGLGAGSAFGVNTMSFFLEHEESTNHYTEVTSYAAASPYFFNNAGNFFNSNVSVGRTYSGATAQLDLA
jgi:hypothetical protein